MAEQSSASASKRAPRGPSYPAPAARFAKSLGVAEEDLPAVGEAFCAILDRLKIDGAAIFKRLVEGQTLAGALGVPAAAAPVLYARAHSWFSIGRVDKAAALFRGLCAIDGENADNWVGLGVCLKALARYADSERALLTGVGLRPDWAVPYFHLAECSLRSGDWPRARDALADFTSRTDDRVPEPLATEAARYRAVIAAHFHSVESNSGEPPE